MTQIKSVKGYPNLENIRKNSTLTEAQIATILGMSVRTYIRKEKGECDFTITEAKILSQLYNQKIEFLFN